MKQFEDEDEDEDEEQDEDEVEDEEEDSLHNAHLLGTIYVDYQAHFSQIHCLKKKWLRTNGRTDGRTNGPTDGPTDKASYDLE